jgi:hypothetical protein
MGIIVSAKKCLYPVSLRAMISSKVFLIDIMYVSEVLVSTELTTGHSLYFTSFFMFYCIIHLSS